MSSGAQHYRMAEEILAQIGTDNRGADVIAAAHASAQVHATLALAAATALRFPDGTMPEGDWGAWYRAAGTPKPKVAPEVSE